MSYTHIPESFIVEAERATQELTRIVAEYEPENEIGEGVKDVVAMSNQIIEALLYKVAECQNTLLTREAELLEANEAVSALQQRLRLERSSPAITNNNRFA